MTSEAGSISSELLMCGGGVCRILSSPCLLWLDARAIDVCIWHMFVSFSDCVGICGNVCCVASVVKNCVY